MQTVSQRMFNIDELATIIRVSKHTIRDWRKASPQRGPRAVKLTASPRGRILFPEEEVDRWLRDPVAYERQNQERKHGRRI
jgi:predicted DNA-binding transcriptional regulator AlpA